MVRVRIRIWVRVRLKVWPMLILRLSMKDRVRAYMSSPSFCISVSSHTNGGYSKRNANAKA